jgi:hypothetical protein
LIPPLFFLLLLELGGSPVALLGGLLLALDNAFLLETRIIRVRATLGALVCFFAAERIEWRTMASPLAGASRTGGRRQTHRPAALGLMAVCPCSGGRRARFLRPKGARQNLLILTAAGAVYAAAG